MKQSTPNVAHEKLLEEKQMGGPVNCSDSELCIYLQALAEGFLPTYYSDINPSAQSKSIAIASKSWRHGRKTGVFPSFQSLMMSRNLTEQSGVDSSILSRAGFPVRTSAPQEKGQESTAIKADCGQSSSASLAKYDRESSSWKTAQLSLLGGYTEFSETWSRWGSIRNGEYFQSGHWEEITKERESGLLPTPVATDCRSESMSLALVSKRQHATSRGVRLGEHLLRRMIPTPNAGSNHWGGTLQELGGSGNIYRGTEIGRLKICPRWTEQRMDFPTDWSALSPLGMRNVREWLQQHSPSFQEDSDA